jgi:Mrp family chromosome partitioning ATPase
VRSASPLALHELFIGTRRQITIIVAVTVAALCLGLLYLVTIPPRYSATAELLIDTQRTRSPLDAPNSAIDLSVVASQIETLKSETIARAVISKLELDSDPEFIKPSLMSRIAAWIEPGTTANSKQRRQRTVIERFEAALDVFLAGRSYAAVVRFTSVDPEKAARITNAVCDAYIEDQLEARTLNAAKASLWFQRRLDELKAQVDRANQALGDFKVDNPGQLDSARQVQLQGLAATAQAQMRAYDTFKSLSGYSQTVEQQTFPTTEARVVTSAAPPLTRSWPSVGTTLLFSVMAGSALGMVIAYAQEHLGGTVRTRQQLERDLNVRCLGFLPLLKRRRRRKSLLGLGGGILFTGHKYSSGGSEPLIGIRIALNACSGSSSTPASIGITSPHLGEGKTTLAFNLAKSMADSGKRVLLVDADLRSLSLTRELVPQAKRGLPEVLRGTLALTDIGVVPGLGFPVLAQPLDRIPQRPPDILSSRQMREMLDGAKSKFDYVVLDLPAAIDHVDACALASHLDLFVLVAEWGRTKTADLEAVWTRCDHLAERVAGVVVNKVPRGSSWH